MTQQLILLYYTINVDWQLSIHFVIHLIIVILPILTIIDKARGLTFRVLMVGIVVNNFHPSYVVLGVDSVVVVSFLLEDLALNSPEKKTWRVKLQWFYQQHLRQQARVRQTTRSKSTRPLAAIPDYCFMFYSQYLPCCCSNSDTSIDRKKCENFDPFFHWNLILNL